MAAVVGRAASKSGSAGVVMRGVQTYTFSIGGWTPRQKETLYRRSKIVIFFTESNMIRGVSSYTIDEQNQTVTLNFPPDRWIPRVRAPLNQENVRNALMEAVERAGGGMP